MAAGHTGTTDRKDMKRGWKYKLLQPRVFDASLQLSSYHWSAENEKLRMAKAHIQLLQAQTTETFLNLPRRIDHGKRSPTF